MRIPIERASAWRGQEQRAPSAAWTYQLSPREVAALKAALDRTRQKEGRLPPLERWDFEVPALSSLVKELQRQLVAGCGVALVRGWPVVEDTEEDAKYAFWALGRALGLPLSQNAKGDVLGHVYDQGLRFGDKNVRGYQTSARLRYHTDLADVVGLMCVRPAMKGGVSLLASAFAIYNVMLQEKPEYLDILCRGFPYDRLGEEGPGEAPVSERVPVFSEYEGMLSTRYIRSYIDSAQLKSGRTLTEEEVAALDYFESIADREDMRLEMRLAPGDMQFLNNYAIVHSRTAFEDEPNPARKRLMLRLWLRLPGKFPVAPWLRTQYGNVGVLRADLLRPHEQGGEPPP